MSLRRKSRRDWGRLGLISKQKKEIAHEWTLRKAIGFIDFNPREVLPKNKIAKKIAMDKLLPFTRDINGYEMSMYKGGTKFRNGDTIMARITPCLENGKIALVNNLGKGEVGFGSTEFIILRAKPGISDATFIYYLSLSPIFRDTAIRSMVGSSGRQRVQQGVLDNLEFYAPQLPEQIEIGSLLKIFDDKIENNNAINKRLEQMAQVIFKSWFVDFEPWGGVMPEDWVTVSLSDIMDYQGGSQPPAAEFISTYKKGYMRFVQIRDYETNSHLTYIPISPKNKICSREDIMIARYGASLGRICFGIAGAYNVALAKVIPKKPEYREFLRCYLTSPDFFIGINNRGNRSAQAGFNQGDIKSFEFRFPCDENVLEDFENVLSPIFQTRMHLKDENEKLAIIRDNLLPRLVSGELVINACSTIN